MTTKDKGITLPSSSSYTDITGAGLNVTNAPFNFTVNAAWSYNAGGSFPLNNAPLTAIAPSNFTVRGQDATASFAATGGNIILRAGAGSVGNASGNIQILDTNGGGGLWNQTHPVLGTYHLWIDSAARLRIKNGVPTSQNDGNVCGIDISAFATYDPPSLTDGTGTTTTVACAGAVLGDFALASFSLDLVGITVTAYVSAANIVSVRFQNESGATVDLASGTLRVRVVKQ